MNQLYSSRKALRRLGTLTLSLALTMFGLIGWAQPPSPPGGESSAAKDQPPPPSPEAQAAEEPVKRTLDDLEERYDDPRAKALLGNEFRALFPGVRLSNRNEIERKLDSMANGEQPLDAAVLSNYVQFLLGQITDRKNIAAMADPDSKDSNGVRALDEAGFRLSRMYRLAEEHNNGEFKTALTEGLIKSSADMLKSQLYSRVIWMVAVSRSGDPAAFPVFVGVLRDPEQPMAVQLLAAIGLSRMARYGAIDVPPARAIDAGKAIVSFLNQPGEAFWPAQFRSVQALGSMRQPGSDPLKSAADLSATVLGLLADPATHPTVRAWSAWALGMIRPSLQTTPYNFRLIASHIGHAVVDVGNRIIQVDPTNPQLSSRLTELMLQFVAAFRGEPGIRNSGLLGIEHPSLNDQRRDVEAIATKVEAVALQAVNLTRSAGGQRAPQRAVLQQAVDDLKTALDGLKLDSLTLYNGSTEFAPRAAELPAEPAPADAKDKSSATKGAARKGASRPRGNTPPPPRP